MGLLYGQYYRPERHWLISLASDSARDRCPSDMNSGLCRPFILVLSSASRRGPPGLRAAGRVDSKRLFSSSRCKCLRSVIIVRSRPSCLDTWTKQCEIKNVRHNWQDQTIAFIKLYIINWTPDPYASILQHAYMIALELCSSAIFLRSD